MAFDRFLIAPFNTGLQTDLKPFLVLDDAFTELQNAYVFRGRVRKRFGSLVMGSNVLTSRLRVNIGTTDASGDLAFTTLPGNVLEIGAMFSIGATILTVYQVPTVVGAGGDLPTLSNTTTVGTLRLLSTPPNVYQLQVSGSDIAIALTTVYWYPGLPVMGITQYETGAINNHPTYAFDTKFVYLYTPASGWNRSGTAVWHGTDTNFFWSTNWQADPGSVVLFTTNFNATVPTPAATDDPIWYTVDGSTWVAASGANAFYFRPAGGAVHTGAYVKTARIIVPFKNRLVLLNTIENDNSGGAGVNTAYPGRARWSWYGNPFAVNAWYEWNQLDSLGNPGAGGTAIDAATDEQIISAEFIKDRLIVYFERSTWELVFTGNQVTPFAFQKINTELGSQSTFSTVPFDKQVLTVGNTGIHSCNGSNVVRIDDKIPNEVFDSFETKNNATIRTAGIRDYYNELAFWTFVETTSTATQTYPNQLLIYNYKNGSWALFDDCFTTFGYFEQQVDLTWATTNSTWANFSGSWTSNIIAANQRQILAGNQVGFVLRISSDISRNAPSLQISNITNDSVTPTNPWVNGNGKLLLTIKNHNFSADNSEGFTENSDFIFIENVTGDVFTETVLNGSIFPVEFVDVNTIRIDTNPTRYGLILTDGEYTGGGTAARVSNIQIATKQINPYMKSDRNVFLHKVDFAVQKTGSIQLINDEYVITGGEITVDYYPSDSSVSMIQGGLATASIMGNSVLETKPYSPVYYPLEQFQDRLWHPIYFQSSGNCIQLYLYMTTNQMVVPSISMSDFELEALVFYTQPTTSRMM
jgi:hypothetical protein